MIKEIKKYERGAEKGVTPQDGIIRLVGYDLNFDTSEILYEQKAFASEDFKNAFTIRSGTWYTEDGWIVGKNPDMRPGMIISKQDYFGDIVLEATVKTHAPSTHDINFMITGEWDETKNCRGHSYVSGLEAFWHANIGFEKTPDYKLTVATQLFDFAPTKEHIFCFGYIDKRKLFVMVDGKLCLEITDPDPLDNTKYGKIGFEAFASWIMIKNIKILKPDYTRENEYYNPEF